VHFTQSCDEDAPQLITNVETTPATTPGGNMVEVVHRSLERRELLPSEHLVDKGYTDARVLVASQRDHGVELIGPVAQDPSLQARKNAGFDKSAFTVDWERNVVTCPAGKESISWLPSTYPAKGTVFEARFARRDCTPRVPPGRYAPGPVRSRASSASKPANITKRFSCCASDKPQTSSASLMPPRRHQEHPCACDSPQRAQARTLSRAGQDPPAACSHSSSH
jgi:hypothetical protein